MLISFYFFCFSEESASESAEPEVSKIKKPQPRWRKKYLTAGLLSDYYKVDNPTKPNNKVLGEKSLAKVVYIPEEHEHGLLPPPAYCDEFVRRRRVHYQLPFDLWWLHTNAQLPGRDIVPSWNYKKIRTSKFAFYYLPVVIKKVKLIFMCYN